MIVLFYKNYLNKLRTIFLSINFIGLITKLIIKQTATSLPKQKQV